MIFPSCFLSISQSISCLFTNVASSELKSLFKICTSLRASSPGCSGGGAGKGWDLATTCLEFKYLHRQIEKVAAKCWLAEMTLIMTQFPLACVFQCLFTLALISASRWLAEIWRLSRRGATGELEVEFKSQRHSCKAVRSPSFSCPPLPKNPPELSCRLNIYLLA